MSVWIENNRIYSNAPNSEAAGLEIDLYALQNGLELSHEYAPKSEFRGSRQIYLKHILSQMIPV
ncbi:MAG TPA: hypothetical protein PLG59_04160 [bacterium]|nr:hypothetical protein [bacterium]HQO33830.1 hypothetical protein [bacterium]HQP99724.1 hypothetical protein [bacterium]